MIAALSPADLPGGWLIDTLIATTLLCLVVLAIRRTVARHFGPHIAYALWLIPGSRMVLPPLPQMIALPSPLVSPPVSPGDILSAPVLFDNASQTVFGEGMTLIGDYLAPAMLGLWLTGALVTLGWQWLIHRRLTRALGMAELVEVVGTVRVYRSDVVNGPLSFGLLEPVIMLPIDDRLTLTAAERALAVRHELTHHARGDLWANCAAVLFAGLHWFNPLMRSAWRAFRFDQEAACDASVLAASDGSQRATYARALAKTASGHPSAFASPMIGPDRLKERLAMLTRPDPSPLRRRVGALLAGTFLIGALFVTATPVLADQSAPSAPPAARVAPAAQQPPVPPVPPMPVLVDDATSVEIWNDNGRAVTRVRDNDGKTIVLHTDRLPTQGEIDQMIAEARASRSAADRAIREADRGMGEADRGMHEADRAKREADRAISEADRAVRDTDRAAVDTARQQTRRIIVRDTAMLAAARASARAGHMAQVRIRQAAVNAGCNGRNASRDITIRTGPQTAEKADVRQNFDPLLCNGDGSLALQLSALRQARAALIAMDGNAALPAEARTEALSELDAEIIHLERQIADRNN